MRWTLPLFFPREIFCILIKLAVFQVRCHGAHIVGRWNPTKMFESFWIVVGRIVIGNSFHYAFTWRMDEKRYYWVTWYGCFNFLRELFFCEHLLLTFWCFLLAIMTSPMTSAMGSRLWEDSQVDQAPKRWKLQYLVEGGAKLLGECENKALFYCNLVWSNVRLGQQVWQKSMIL